MREHSIRPRAALKATMSLLLVWLALGGCVSPWSDATYQYEVPAREGGKTVQLEVRRYAEGKGRSHEWGCARTFDNYVESPPALSVDGRPATHEEYEYYLPLLYLPTYKKASSISEHGFSTEYYEFPAIGDPSLGMRPKS